MRRQTVMVIELIGIIGLLLHPSALVWGYKEVTVANGGNLSGVVVYHGPQPLAEPVSISKDQDVCGKTEKQSEALVVGANKGVQNAVVSLVNIQQGKRLTSALATIDQKDCRYVPHVSLIPAGGELRILNSDGILHNFHTHSEKNPPINKAQPKFKKMMKERFHTPEVIKITCDAHAWMSGWLVVIEHPYYAVTDATGSFMLKDIPPGSYEVRVWHEFLREKAVLVLIAPNASQRLQVELVAP